VKDGVVGTCAAAIALPTFGDDCAMAIKAANDAKECQSELVTQVCKLPNAPSDCSTTINGKITPVPPAA
jgi:hypothetical protein